MKGRRLWVWLLAFIAIASGLLTLTAVHYRSVRAADRRLVKSVFDDECARVLKVRENLALATEVNNDSMIARARAFQRLLALEPQMLSDPDGRFDECRKLLGIDELHVSDAQGTLIASQPKSSLGLALGSVAQYSRFLPAITNRAFELVQEPIVKVTDRRAMQYAGVARQDAPGVILVGQCAEFIRELRRMTTSSFLSSVTRVGKFGCKTLTPLADEMQLPPPVMRTERVGGKLTYVYEGSSAGMRIRIEMPVQGPAFLPPGIGWFFGAFGGLAFILLLIALRGTPSVSTSATRRLTVSPVTALLVIIFFCSAVLSWTMEEAAARYGAEAQLSAAIKDALAAEDAFWAYVYEDKMRSDGMLDIVSNDVVSDRFYTNFATGWHVGNGGYFLCYNRRTGEIVSSGSPNYHDGDTVTGVGFDVERDTGSGARVFVNTLYGESCLCAADHLDHGEGRIVAVIPMRVIEQESKRAAFFTITVVGIAILFLMLFMNRLSRIAGSLRSYIEDDKSKREQDLRLARTIRRSVMPTEFPDTADFRLAAALPEQTGEEEIGGDFYDFYTLPSGRLFVMVGAANTSGIAAAMEMMKTKAIVKSLAASSSTLTELVENTNAELCRVNDAKVTVTAFFAVYDSESGVVLAVNAGYREHPLGGEVSPALGADPKSRYVSAHHILKPGDELSVGGILRLTNLKSSTVRI